MQCCAAQCSAAQSRGCSYDDGGTQEKSHETQLIRAEDERPAMSGRMMACGRANAVCGGRQAQEKPTDSRSPTDQQEPTNSTHTNQTSGKVPEGGRGDTLGRGPAFLFPLALCSFLGYLPALRFPGSQRAGLRSLNPLFFSSSARSFPSSSIAFCLYGLRSTCS